MACVRLWRSPVLTSVFCLDELISCRAECLRLARCSLIGTQRFGDGGGEEGWIHHNAVLHIVIMNAEQLLKG